MRPGGDGDTREYIVRMWMIQYRYGRNDINVHVPEHVYVQAGASFVKLDKDF